MIPVLALDGSSATEGPVGIPAAVHVGVECTRRWKLFEVSCPDMALDVLEVVEICPSMQKSLIWSLR